LSPGLPLAGLLVLTSTCHPSPGLLLAGLLFLIRGRLLLALEPRY
jgi:hypothetical protein